LLNVAAGGALHQDIHACIGKQCMRHFQKTMEETTWHRVTAAEGSLLAAVMGERNPAVNSYHHQAVSRVAEGFNVVAVAPDGVVEAIENPAHPFALGVQWHPELLWREHASHHALFRAHVEAARKAMAASGT
jgi:putative glutamine amidotransferase